MDLSERFWSKVDKRGPDECWEWMGARSTKGYGNFYVGAGRWSHAQRVSWELTNGCIPAGDGFHGTCVCHRCDNPPCVNPAHLFLGSIKDNLHDMLAKRRHNKPRGSANWCAKLTEADVVAIRAAAEHEMKKTIAARYGVDPSVISRIVSRKKWAHV